MGAHDTASTECLYCIQCQTAEFFIENESSRYLKKFGLYHEKKSLKQETVKHFGQCLIRTEKCKGYGEFSYRTFYLWILNSLFRYLLI